MATDRSGVTFEASEFIARSPADLWAFLLDLENDKKWRSGMIDAQMTSDPPIGLGSTGMHVAERMGEIHWKVTDWEEERLMGWDWMSGSFEGSHGSYRIEPEAEGSRMLVRAEMRGGFLARMMMALMKPMMARQLASDLRKLKAIMEA